MKEIELLDKAIENLNGKITLDLRQLLRPVMVEKIEKEESKPVADGKERSPLAVSIKDACKRVNKLYMELDVILNSTEL